MSIIFKKKNILHIIIGLGKGGAEKTLFNVIKNTKDHFNHHVISLQVLILPLNLSVVIKKLN